MKALKLSFQHDTVVGASVLRDVQDDCYVSAAVDFDTLFRAERGIDSTLKLHQMAKFIYQLEEDYEAVYLLKSIEQRNYVFVLMESGRGFILDKEIKECFLKGRNKVGDIVWRVIDDKLVAVHKRLLTMFNPIDDEIDCKEEDNEL